MDSKLKKTFRKLFQIASREDEDESIEIEKIDGALTPNMRAIRLAMSMADALVSMGMPVADVVSMALDVTDRYCHHKVRFDINSTLITASQDRGNDREPLTMVHPSQLRSPNYLAVRDIHTLIKAIRGSKMSLSYAEQRFDEIVKKPLEYPTWLILLGNAIITGGVGVYFGAKPIMIFIMFVIGLIMSSLMHVLYKKRIPPFYVQATIALVSTVGAALVAWGKNTLEIPWLDGVHPTYIVIGGIVLLVAGLAVVGAVQDAIDEFYITANARLLKVFIMTGGIIAGVLVGLYFTKKLGVTIKADSTDLSPGLWPLPVVGGAIIALGYAITVQTNIKGLIISSALGALVVTLYMWIVGDSPISSATASGGAAIIVATLGTLISRVSRTPSVALVMAGIVSLTPGLALYNALSTIMHATSDDQMFSKGALMLFNVALIGVSIAAGASFGHLIGRPIRRSVVWARNALPRPDLGQE